MGYIKGSQEPDKFVLVSNHYDAWTYGAVDPNSGTSTLLEVSRALKQYQNQTGWIPGILKMFHRIISLALFEKKYELETQAM